MHLPLSTYHVVPLYCGGPAPQLIGGVYRCDGQYAEQHAEFLLDLETLDTRSGGSSLLGCAKLTR